MGKAKVSVSCVTKFRTSVNEEKANAVSLKSAVACVETIVQKANAEIAKITECDKNCKIALRTATEKLEVLQKKLVELQSRLAVTPPTIMVSEPCGTDEEGNTIYEEVEEPNPEYYALLNQISEVEAKISKLKALINDLRAKMQQLSQAKQTYQDAITHLNNGKKEIIVCGDNISKKSDMASSQLQKAIAAIQKYLGETVHTERVPSHTSVIWTNHSNVTTINSSTMQEREISRLVPGVPGVVVVKIDKNGKPSGNSTILARNLFKEFDIPMSSYSEEDQANIKKKMPGYEAQHIIPIEMSSHPVIIKIGMDMNNAKNGIPLPVPSESGHALSTHKGYHSIYNKVVNEYLDKIAEKVGPNATVAEVEVEVAKLQEKLRAALQSGLPMYARKTDALDREVWDRGGGATMDLWRRFLDKEN